MSSQVGEASRSPGVEGPARRREHHSPKPDPLEVFHEEAKFGKTYDTRVIRRLWPFISPHRRLLTIAMASIAITSALALTRPLLMRFAIDDGVLAGNVDRLFQGGLALALVVLGEQALAFFQIYATQIVGARALSSLRRHLFDHLHRLPLSFFDRQPIGRLVTRVTNDVDAVLELFSSGALNAFGDLLKLGGIVALMVALDPSLSLIAFCALPPVALLVVLVRRKAREAFREIRAKTARMNATLNEQINGAEVIQAYRREEQAQREFDLINGAYRDANLRSIKYEAMQDAAIDAVAAWCLAFVVVAVGYEPVSFGTVVAFNAYLIQFFEPISALGQRYTLLQSALSGAERITTLLDVDLVDAPARSANSAAEGSDRGLDSDPALTGHDSAPTPEAKVNDVALGVENIHFSYKANVPILRGISFDVSRGEKIAIVGPTGSGKTTIASLLMRLYELDSGEIRLFGKDIRDLSREALRNHFAMVPQDLYLFTGTVASNIAGSLNPDLARVEDVVKRLDIHDLFATRSNGLLTPVLDQGSNFSAGERQLIAFGRALYHDAPIVVLDEATASVDSNTEARIQSALDRLLLGRTALVIAHRLSTIRAADRILVFQKGRLIEQGAHAELVRLGGLYAKLHELQFAQSP